MWRGAGGVGWVGINRILQLFCENHQKDEMEMERPSGWLIHLRCATISCTLFSSGGSEEGIIWSLGPESRLKSLLAAGFGVSVKWSSWGPSKQPCIPLASLPNLLCLSKKQKKKREKLRQAQFSLFFFSCNRIIPAWHQLHSSHNRAGNYFDTHMAQKVQSQGRWIQK